MSRICFVLLIAFSFLHNTGHAQKARGRNFAVILQADTGGHEGLARALHALLYAEELKEGGYSVVLIFDGAGTTWAEALQDSTNKLHSLYEQLKRVGVVEEICDFCSGAFRVKQSLKSRNVPLFSEFKGHPSIKKWVDEGYEIIVLELTGCLISPFQSVQPSVATWVFVGA